MADASGSDIELDNSDVEAELLVSPNPASIPSSVPTAEGTQTTVTNLDDSQALAEVPEGSDAPVLQQEIDVVPNAATLAEIRPNEPNPDAAEVQTALNDVSHVDAAPTLPAAVTAAPDAAPQVNCFPRIRVPRAGTSIFALDLCSSIFACSQLCQSLLYSNNLR